MWTVVGILVSCLFGRLSCYYETDFFSWIPMRSLCVWAHLWSIPWWTYRWEGLNRAIDEPCVIESLRNPLLNRRIQRRRDSQLLTLINKTNSRTAERRSTSSQVITAFFPSGQRVRTRFRANLTWSYLPTSNKSSHSRLTKHSFGVDKGEGLLSYIMLWWIGWLHSLWGKNSSFWFNCKKTTNLFLEFYTKTKKNSLFIQIPKKWKNRLS